jgi:inorganic pyrophosphatase
MAGPNLVHDIPLRHGDELQAIVEVPRGSELKLTYEAELGLFLWSRALPLGVRFPFDFGFLPQTLAEDGDPMDVVIYADLTSVPGVLVRGRAIGALRVTQQRDGGPVKRNDRLIVVPSNAHRSDELTEVSQLPERVRAELEAFFHASLVLTGKQIRLEGWAGASETAALVAAGAEAYQRAHGKRSEEETKETKEERKERKRQKKEAKAAAAKAAKRSRGG